MKTMEPQGLFIHFIHCGTKPSHFYSCLSELHQVFRPQISAGVQQSAAGLAALIVTPEVPERRTEHQFAPADRQQLQATPFSDWVACVEVNTVTFLLPSRINARSYSVSGKN